ncbi:MAG TPA: PH domain-containing protein [Nitrososphaerales archaeon]|nr:PH domain-containing protein [Nitrososphaerales archaeon]
MQRVPEDVKKLLGSNEAVQLYIRQKIYHPKVNIDSIVLTNQRVILRHPHALGLKKDYTDYTYQDISNVRLDKGILRSTIRCALRFGGVPLELPDLPNSDADRAYGLIRENLARWQLPQASAPAGMSPSLQVSRQPAPVTPAAEPVVIEKEVVKIRCKYCGTLNDETARVCSSCGGNL